jgi:hypothetical protein
MLASEGNFLIAITTPDPQPRRIAGALGPGFFSRRK